MIYNFAGIKYLPVLFRALLIEALKAMKLGVDIHDIMKGVEDAFRVVKRTLMLSLLKELLCVVKRTLIGQVIWTDFPGLPFECLVLELGDYMCGT